MIKVIYFTISHKHYIVCNKFISVEKIEFENVILSTKCNHKLAQEVSSTHE